MSKRIARLAVVAGAALALAVPAAPASAGCDIRWVDDCVEELMPAVPCVLYLIHPTYCMTWG